VKQRFQIPLTSTTAVVGIAAETAPTHRHFLASDLVAHSDIGQIDGLACSNQGETLFLFALLPFISLLSPLRSLLLADCLAQDDAPLPGSTKIGP
jgi:hypothetical protein